jgi:hypothetical protein
MSRRGQQTAVKRAKEKARQEKQAAKRERRAAKSTSDDPAIEIDEKALWEEYARLSERHASDAISPDRYEKERDRILAELGIEPDF